MKQVYDIDTKQFDPATHGKAIHHFLGLKNEQIMYADIKGFAEEKKKLFV
jgi:hypothetical protein